MDRYELKCPNGHTVILEYEPGELQGEQIRAATCEECNAVFSFNNSKLQLVSKE